MSLQRVVLVAMLSVGASLALGQGEDIDIKDPWVRATAPGQPVAGAYMEISSVKDAKLIKVETPVAKTVEIHSMKMQDGVMRMRAIDELPLPAGVTVKLAPGRYHLMLMEIQQALKPGDSVPIRLTVKSSNGKEKVLVVVAPVKDATQ